MAATAGRALGRRRLMRWIGAACVALTVAGCAPAGSIQLSGSWSHGEYVRLGGSYRPEWSALDTSGRGCHFSATVGPGSLLALDSVLPASKAQSGTAAAFSVPAGDYVFGVSSDCGSWTVRLTPG